MNIESPVQNELNDNDMKNNLSSCEKPVLNIFEVQTETSKHKGIILFTLAKKTSFEKILEDSLKICHESLEKVFFI